MPGKRIKHARDHSRKEDWSMGRRRIPTMCGKYAATAYVYADCHACLEAEKKGSK